VKNKQSEICTKEKVAGENYDLAAYKQASEM
jgi:hypothetical protein